MIGRLTFDTAKLYKGKRRAALERYLSGEASAVKVGRELRIRRQLFERHLARLFFTALSPESDNARLDVFHPDADRDACALPARICTLAICGKPIDEKRVARGSCFDTNDCRNEDRKGRVAHRNNKVCYACGRVKPRGATKDSHEQSDPLCAGHSAQQTISESETVEPKTD